MKFRIKNLKLKIILLFTIHYSLFALSGCDAFRKKFVRKSKKEKEVNVITQTKDYKALYSPDVAYNQYYLFWRSSHDELMETLDAQNGSGKRMLFFAHRIVEYLEQMQELLTSEKYQELEPFIAKQKDVVEKLKVRRMNRAQKLEIKSILKKQKKQIQQRFTLKHIQEYLVKE